MPDAFRTHEAVFPHVSSSAGFQRFSGMCAGGLTEWTREKTAPPALARGRNGMENGFADGTTTGRGLSSSRPLFGLYS